MATSKKKKVAKKKPVPTKKKPVQKKVATKKQVKPSTKKTSKKAQVAKKRKPVMNVAAKPIPKPAPKPVAKPAAKPVAKAAPVVAPKAKRAAPAVSDYRNCRKYTHPKLTEMLADEASIRAALNNGNEGTLAAWELVEYLKILETVVPDWKKAALTREAQDPSQKRRRGRPSKADIAARAAAVKPLVNKAQADNAMAKAAAFSKGAPALAPKPVALGAPLRLVPRLLVKPVSSAN